MARNTLRLDLTGFSDLMEKLDAAGGDMKNAADEALTKVGKRIGSDTVDAVAKSNLPRGGKYSRGNTEKSVVRNPEVDWDGNIATIGVGFDYEKPGAGGLLITGTPRMKPDYALNTMYKNKKYMAKIQKDMGDVLNRHIKNALGG